MLPGKGKHGLKRSGKGTKESGGKVMPSGSKSKEAPHTPPQKVKMDTEDVRDTPPGLPIMRTVDNARVLPRYTAVLTRDKEVSVGVEELDALQLELEALLSCAALRHRALLDDIALTESLDERQKKSKLASQKPAAAAAAAATASASSSATPPSLLKRSTVRPDTRPPKKNKAEGAKPDVPSAGKLNKLRGLPDAQSPKPDAPEVPKNDLPDKFWASVEPYCRPITAEDISYLQDLIRTREEERSSDLYTIPPLGKHYTQRWAEEDAGDLPKRPTQQGGTAGPMTQRLVAALVEDRSITQGVLEHDRGRELSAPRAAALSHVKSLAFESRVRDELREQGILDGDEAPKEQADDELLLEMKRCQSELKALSSHNLQRLRHLHALAEAQMNRQELKKKVQTLNSEILKMHASKLEKKHLTKKEREICWRHIKELKGVLKELYPNLATKN